MHYTKKEALADFSGAKVHISQCSDFLRYMWDIKYYIFNHITQAKQNMPWECWD